EPGELLRQHLGLGVGELGVGDHDQLVALRLVGESVLERERADLLRQVMGMAAHDRAEGLAAAAELRRRLGAVAGAAGALLLVPLGRGQRDFAARLRLVRACLALRQLVADHALQDVGARLQPEDIVGQADRAALFAVEAGYLAVHHSAPFASAGCAPAPFLNAPGVGTPSGSFRLTASRTKIQPPLAPGTEPSTMIRPRSTSVFTTLRFCVVTRSSPIWPAIFLPLKTLPGSCRWPVEPAMRWESELPWVARPPLKFQRFITPWKPLPIEVPVTSTNWPTTKWSAVSSAPTSMRLSGLTRNSASVRFGSTDDFAKCPRSAFGVFFTLREPAPS